MGITSIVKKSFEVTKRCRSLWVFGIFLAAGALSDETHEAHAAASFPAAVASALPWWMPLLLVAGAIVGAIAIAMHIVSEGAVISGVARDARGEATTFRQGLHEGREVFWALAKVKVVMLSLAVGAGALLFGPLLFAVAKEAAIATILAVAIPATIIAIPGAMSLFFIYELAMRYVVLDNRHSLDAIHKARLFLHGRLGTSLNMLLAAAFGYAAFFAALVAMAIGAALPAVAAYFVFGMWTAMGTAAVLCAPVTLVLLGMIGTYQSAVWTTGFLAQR